MLRELKGSKPVSSVAFTPDGTILAVGSEDWSVRLWQVTDGTLLDPSLIQTGGVLRLALSPDGRILAAGNQDDSLELWQVSARTLLAAPQKHQGWIRSVAFIQ